MKKLSLIPFILSILFEGIFFLTISHTSFASCPASYDTVVRVDATKPGQGLCTADSDAVGFDTIGGFPNSVGGQCGDFTCNGAGHQCVVNISGKCYVGNGKNGYQVPNCTAYSPLVQTTCPTLLNLSMRAQDSNGNGISGVTFTIYYGMSDKSTDTTGAYTATAVSNANGDASDSTHMYSGTNYYIIPSKPGYTFTGPQSHSTAMNTYWSCGSERYDGVQNPPCVATGNATLYTLSGNVYKDFNNNGKRDSEDTNYTSGAVVKATRLSDNATFNDTTDANGNYSMQLVNDSYSLTITSPSSGYSISTTNPLIINMNTSNQTNQNIGLTPLYTISGTIFNDVNKNRNYDNPPDTQLTGNNVINIQGASGNPISINTNGAATYSQSLPPGTYQVTYTIPSGYQISLPGPPPTYSITVGTPGKSISCNTGSYTGSSCDTNGNATNINFGITKETSWVQTTGEDWREDSGITNTTPNPNSGICSSASGINSLIPGTNAVSPGIFFSGDSTSTFSPGNVSSKNWLAGGLTYPEKFNPVNAGVIRTSYTYMQTTIKQSGIKSTDLSGTDGTSGQKYCGAGSIANCTLEINLPNGVYIANTDLSLNTYTFPPGKNYVILVNGNLAINGNILIPTGSSVVFSVAKNIYVSPLVGQSTISSQDANIQGLYSADNNFIVKSNAGAQKCNSDGTPLDKRLNITGGIVVNAALQSPAGTFQNLRDLCSQDISCPTVSIGLGNGNISGTNTGAGIGLSYLLNAPNFIKHKNFLWQEIAPGAPVPSQTINPTPTPAPCSGLIVSAPVNLNKTSVSTGQSITGNVTYINPCNFNYTANNIIIAARNNNGGNEDFSPGTGQITIPAGQSVSLSSSRTILSTDISGTWYAFATYKDTNNNWYADPNHVNFTVTAATTPTPTPTQTPSPTPTPNLCPNGQTGWTCADIGNPTPAGSQTYSSGSWTIKGGGADIWNTSDQFHYIWQPFNGDGSISTKVVSQTNSNNSAKAGVMFRETNNPGSPFYAIYVTPGAGISVQYRLTQGGTVTIAASSTGTAPTYLMATRSGAKFSAAISADGSSWQYVTNSTVSITLSDPILAGLAVTSHNTAATSSVIFNYTIITTPNIYLQDTFARSPSNQTYWGTASDGNTWGIEGNSSTNFSIVNNTGKINANSIRTASLGSPILNAEVLATGTLSSFSSGYISVILRFQDEANWYRAVFESSGLSLQKNLSGNGSTLGTPYNFSPTAGTLYSIRFRVAGNTLSAKVWTGSTEPSGWQTTATDETIVNSGFSGVRSNPSGATATYTSFKVLAF